MTRIETLSRTHGDLTVGHLRDLENAKTRHVPSISHCTTEHDADAGRRRPFSDIMET